MEPWMAALAGGVAGATAAFYAAKLYASQRFALEQGALKSELATLAERLSARESRLAEVQGRLEAAAAEAVAARDELTGEKTARARAEEAAKQRETLEEEARVLRRESAELREKIAQIETRAAEESKAAAEKLALVEDARARLAETFKALSSDALKSSSQSFLDLAKATMESFQTQARADLDKRQTAIGEMVGPVRETLTKFDTKLGDLEKNRTDAYADLRRQLETVSATQEKLRANADNLVKALSSPNVRGAWGELQLRRVVELAGMLEHCDFESQVSVPGGEGSVRPDMLVYLPGGRSVVVDSKAPLKNYLDAMQASDPAIREGFMRDYAAGVRRHMEQLAKKNYWEKIEPTPEFVVLFLPGENYFSAALERDLTLLEDAAEQRVIFVSPTSLIALLKAVAYGWKQETLADHAKQIFQLGRELHERIGVVLERMNDTGTHISRALASHNEAARSFNQRLGVTIRKFEDYQCASTKKIGEAKLLDESPTVPIDIAKIGAGCAMKGAGELS